RPKRYRAAERLPHARHMEAGGANRPFRRLDMDQVSEAAMPVLEDVRKLAEKFTGWSRPSGNDLVGLVRERKANAFRFKDDGFVPNHPKWPLIVYRGALRLPDSCDPAAIFEDLFARNGWGDSWRDGIYDYVHYHSGIHEVLGIARGSGKVQFGGPS